MRTTLGVIVGYVFFGVASVALFVASGQQPHDPAETGFMVLATIYGMVVALVAGFFAALIAGRHETRAGGILSLVIGLGAVVSMFTIPEGGHRWSMIAALFLMAPMAWLGSISLTILKQQLSNRSKETPGGRA